MSRQKVAGPVPAKPLAPHPPPCFTPRFPAAREGIARGYAPILRQRHPAAGAGAETAIGGHMPLYECVFIARNDVTQAQVDTIADQITTVLTEQGGEVKKREYWGLRGLAYKIKKNRKGHYMLLGIDATPAAMQEAERQLGLNEDVLREMTLRIETIDEAPSAILSRRGEERERDRGFRGPRPPGRFTSGRRERGDEREEFRARPRDEMEPSMGGEE